MITARVKSLLAQSLKETTRHDAPHEFARRAAGEIDLAFKLGCLSCVERDAAHTRLKSAAATRSEQIRRHQNLQMIEARA